MKIKYIHRLIGFLRNLKFRLVCNFLYLPDLKIMPFRFPLSNKIFITDNFRYTKKNLENIQKKNWPSVILCFGEINEESLSSVLIHTKVILCRSNSDIEAYLFNVVGRFFYLEVHQDESILLKTIVNNQHFILLPRVKRLKEVSYFKNMPSESDDTFKYFYSKKILPSIGVIFTTYNSGNTIVEAIRSILENHYEKLEVIVVDDASEDNIETKLNDLRAEYPDANIRFHRKDKNSGTYISRNIGMQLSESDWVTFHDSDDVSSRFRLSETANAILREPEKTAVMGKYRRVNQDDQILTIGRHIDLKGLITFTIKKKTVIEKMGYFDSVRFAGDSEYYFRYRKVFGESSISIIPLSLYIARLDEKSLSGNLFQKIKERNYSRDTARDPNRKEYVDRFRAWHDSNHELYIPFPQQNRPFPIPDRMKPDYKKITS